MKKPKVRISNWQISNDHGFYHLVGKAHDHPLLGTTDVRTSALLKVDFKNNTAETINSIYLLDLV